jgi:formylglycine-generating enzyme required for sulfatase activity
MKYLLLLLAATSLFAKDPEILKMSVDTGSFALISKITGIDTVRPGTSGALTLDTTTILSWQGIVTYSCRDSDNDSMGVFIDVALGNDTVPVDSVWGVTRAFTGNNLVSYFTFHTGQKAWKGQTPAKIRLSLDDVFPGFSGRPRIIGQPQNISTLLGLPARFSVLATGNPTPAYQWSFNGKPLIGGDSSDLIIPAVDSLQAGTYRVTISNGNGSTTSQAVALTVNYAPIIVVQPHADTVDTGRSAAFAVVGRSYPTFACQWLKNGVPIPGATLDSFAITSVSTGDSGSYSVMLSNLVGNAFSSPASLTVNYAPTFSRPPRAASARIGQSALFEARASGRPSPAYQWQFDGVAIPGEIHATLSITAARASDTGRYSVVASNRLGSTTSAIARFSLETQTFTPDTFITVPGGTFLMGKARLSEPVHQVKLSAFKMGRTLVTQGEYRRVTGINPAFFAGDSLLPVENVTWFDAVLYCNKKSVLDSRDTVYRYTAVTGTPFNGCKDLPGLVIDPTKNGYRLPTEAEYEYVCRAGTDSDYFWGGSYPPQTHEDTAAIDCYAVWFHNSGGKTQKVGSKQPNSWEFFDMVGQTWQWLNDWYGAYPEGEQTDPQGPATGFGRTVRGGSWSPFDDDSHLRSMARNGGYFPDDRSSLIGFRIVLPP